MDNLGISEEPRKMRRLCYVWCVRYPKFENVSLGVLNRDIYQVNRFLYNKSVILYSGNLWNLSDILGYVFI